MGIAALVFDLDGTLVDSAEDIAEAINRSLEELSLSRVSEATVRSWIGEGVRRLVAIALAHAGSARAADEVMPLFMRHYHDCLLRSPRLYDGVADALRQLQARGLPMAICTNKPSALVPPLLAHLVLRAHRRWRHAAAAQAVARAGTACGEAARPRAGAVPDGR